MICMNVFYSHIQTFLGKCNGRKWARGVDWSELQRIILEILQIDEVRKQQDKVEEEEEESERLVKYKIDEKP